MHLPYHEPSLNTPHTASHHAGTTPSSLPHQQQNRAALQSSTCLRSPDHKGRLEQGQKQDLVAALTLYPTRRHRTHMQCTQHPTKNHRRHVQHPSQPSFSKKQRPPFSSTSSLLFPRALPLTQKRRLSCRNPHTRSRLKTALPPCPARGAWRCRQVRTSAVYSIHKCACCCVQSAQVCLYVPSKASA